MQNSIAPGAFFQALLAEHRLKVDEKVTSLEEDLAQATLEAEADWGSSPQDEASAELQPILSRHANAAGLRSQQRVQHLDWVRACTDVEALPGTHAASATSTSLWSHLPAVPVSGRWMRMYV